MPKSETRVPWYVVGSPPPQRMHARPHKHDIEVRTFPTRPRTENLHIHGVYIFFTDTHSARKNDLKYICEKEPPRTALNTKPQQQRRVEQYPNRACQVSSEPNRPRNIYCHKRVSIYLHSTNYILYLLDPNGLNIAPMHLYPGEQCHCLTPAEQI